MFIPIKCDSEVQNEFKSRDVGNLKFGLLKYDSIYSQEKIEIGNPCC